ncbi:hypothetical protein [Streptomyces sp. TP-A0874]|uniref:hypothetical protein n=1 Tax=Streptomyces sp. TP-A0874 TaxID=549819 RepID=UPI00085333ED|nr:hypothetical protein [Streptomyces sp. TP-A0874]
MNGLLRLIPDQPSWLVWALPLAAAVLAVAVVVAGVRSLRRSAWLSGIGPQAFVALGGVAVSVYGLWGFATQTVHLPVPLAVAFIGVFDAAEMTLLVMLYRAADPALGWTRQLRLMHRTAWMLVAFSAGMNAAHAPNWLSRPVLAAVPALAAWLIELQLRQKLGAAVPDDDPASRPGPGRLVTLVWQHCWSWLFAVLGLDARHSGDVIARSALAQRAARRVYRLRLALAAQETAGGWRRRRALSRAARRRGQAQRMLSRAEVATDRDQALAMSRHLASLTGVDSVARLDYSDPAAVVTMVEQLAITPAVEHLEAGGRAAEAESARKRAEDARREAEDARQRAEAALEGARQALADAREEAERVRTDRDAALATRQEADSAVADARQRAEDARREADTARQRAEDARQEAEDARKRAETDLTQVKEAVTDQHRLLDSLKAQEKAHRTTLEQLTGQIGEAETVRDRLRGDLATLNPTTAAADPVWRSEAKQQGWQLYLASLADPEQRTEPTAADLASECGIHVGNARNWLKEFRAARAAQLAARKPRATAHPPRTTTLEGVSA